VNGVLDKHGLPDPGPRPARLESGWTVTRPRPLNVRADRANTSRVRCADRQGIGGRLRVDRCRRTPRSAITTGTPDRAHPFFSGRRSARLRHKALAVTCRIWRPRVHAPGASCVAVDPAARRPSWLRWGGPFFFFFFFRAPCSDLAGREGCELIAGIRTGRRAIAGQDGPVTICGCRERSVGRGGFR